MLNLRKNGIQTEQVVQTKTDLGQTKLIILFHNLQIMTNGNTVEWLYFTKSPSSFLCRVTISSYCSG